MPAWLKPIIWAVTSVGVLQAVIHGNRPRIDRFFMGVFRDLGRFKAKKRRYANSKGLMLKTLLRQDDPLEDLLLLDEDAKNNNNNDLATYTPDELAEFGDGLDGRPILLSLFGRVYDVSAGEKFYGPNGQYHMFAGNDVTYSLSTGCKTPSCIGKDTEELSEQDLNEGKRWLSFFHLHDKYPLVGTMETDHVQILLDELILQQQAADGEGGSSNNLPPILQ